APAACTQGVFIEPLRAVTSQRSLAESITRLPCRYQGSVGERVVQVTWYKELRDEFGSYASRMRFESDKPTSNSALLIPNTEESDDGTYTCHISTFPNGNFERRIKLTVWVLPIASLEPLVLVEGQSFRVAASCRAVGRPLPTLSWDTTVPGQTHNRTNEGGSVSSYYSLHPLRSMNGKNLDCLVRHPGLEHPRRITNKLVVHCKSICGAKYIVAIPNKYAPFHRVLASFLAEKSQRKETVASDSSILVIIIGVSAAAAVLLMAVVVLLLLRHHRRRNKKLVRQLSDSGLPSSLLPLKNQSDDAVGTRDPSDVCEISVPTPEENWGPPTLTAPAAGGPECEEDAVDSYQLSRALTNHFYYSNGTLRPRPQTNGILLHPHGQLI
uniref:Nectin cell adhesion molecule 4b n=1 Tax=Hippocampus comes TaxID=109280 RepID=A0A3Q2XZP2_HIPCM